MEVSYGSFSTINCIISPDLRKLVHNNVLAAITIYENESNCLIYCYIIFKDSCTRAITTYITDFNPLRDTQSFRTFTHPRGSPGTYNSFNSPCDWLIRTIKDNKTMKITFLKNESENTNHVVLGRSSLHPVIG